MRRGRGRPLDYSCRWQPAQNDRNRLGETLTQVRARLLLVDDDESALEALTALFSEDYAVTSVASGEEAIAAIKQHADIAAIVMDIRMPRMDGITAARQIRELAPDTPLIFHTAYPGEYNQDEIDEREQPYDYVEKAGPISRLTRAVRNAVEAYHAREDNSLARLGTAYGMVGRSRSMLEVFRLVSKVARASHKVMILGETGTGKELVARALHAASRRRDHRLAIFSCNHKSADLVESELFGHVRGAFTGAVEDRIGHFAWADGGTIFLDEIGDLDITTQAKLLRVLESGEFQVLGSPEVRTADVRVVCATHRRLEDLVEAGAFREDLYYRLKGVEIVLPPLRDRREDIP
ncbi:response regulator, partial [candidate division GN15 bacterium]|nr:response regulator [candidate division GN15 bacterium]